MKKLRVILSVVGGIVVLAVLFVMAINIGMGDIRRLVIKEIDLSRIADGVYDGSYHKGRWTYDVQVTVKNHQITAVKNTNRRMAAFESINEKAAAAVIAKQSPVIDVVSGATISTKAFQKAVQTALEEPPKP